MPASQDTGPFPLDAATDMLFRGREPVAISQREEALQ